MIPWSGMTVRTSGVNESKFSEHMMEARTIALCLHKISNHALDIVSRLMSSLGVDSINGFNIRGSEAVFIISLEQRRAAVCLSLNANGPCTIARRGSESTRLFGVLCIPPGLGSIALQGPAGQATNYAIKRGYIWTSQVGLRALCPDKAAVNATFSNRNMSRGGPTSRRLRRVSLLLFDTYLLQTRL